MTDAMAGATTLGGGKACGCGSGNAFSDLLGSALILETGQVGRSGRGGYKAWNRGLRVSVKDGGT